MSLAPGSRLGPYEVLSSIGAGGMGEVYRARDSTLHRDVALKVLPEAFASDPDRLARFEREAQLLASLNHPNIAAIYGFHDNALVLELVEGPTLADRIAGGPLPLDEALPIARQIADALDAAHEQGVIHRDLKPSNIKVRLDGTVKVLDFGLAKALEPVNGSSEVSRSPTITSPAMTRIGMVLGTAAYMSPEQARGHQTDRRSDVWAFGCVLYEMLTGTRVFDMREMSDTIAAVLRAEPDWTKLSAQLPEPITTLLHRCLEKDSRRRLRDIGDARLELDARAESVSGPIDTASRRRERIVWTTAVAVLLLAALGLGAWAIRPAPVSAEVRLTIETPGESDPRDLASLAVSPDGLNVAFVAAVGGQPHVWVRPLGALASRPLLGTAGASVPFWSADSKSVAFYADGWLKRIDVAGGLVRNLTKAVFGFGGAWNNDGAILFVPSPGSPIFRTSTEGAAPLPVTRPTGNQSGHAHPHFLPDGRHFLYFVQGPSETRGIYVGDIDGPVTQKLFDADSAAVYTSGYLLFVRQATLFAQAFDARRLEPAGNPLAVADDVRGSLLAGLSAEGGVLAFRAGPTGTRRQFRWLDRTGKEIERVGDPGSEKLSPSVSPDGGQLAFYGRVEGTNTDIWLLETRRGVLTRFTDRAADDVGPVWSRDGSRIAYTSNQGGSFGLYQKSATAAGREEPLISEAGVFVMASDWSPGDRILLYQRGDDIWALPMVGSERKPFPVIQTEFDEQEGMFSPDGRWMSYVSNSSGGFEAYVRPFPGPGQTVRVSTRGGAQVRWRADGRELFYVALDGTLMAVPIEMSANGLTLTPGVPKPLFTTHIGRVINPGGTGPNYIVSGDGQRFLMSIIAQETSATPIRLFVNWKPQQ